ncbi:MAG: hypothetical protein GY811_29105 [Myxococcales bacterium]|nr:hypothetical protein [Myxococcales bacterium]
MRFLGVSRVSGAAPVVLSALLGAALGTGCDEDGNTRAKVPTMLIDAAPAPNPALGRLPQDLKYEATISGFTRFMRDLRVAIMSNDTPATGLMVASLRLEDYASWMTQTFGESLGKKLSEQYKPQSEEIGQIVEVLREQFDKGLTEIEIGRYQSSDNPSVTGYQSAALSKMVAAVPLYSVRLMSKNRKQMFHISSFVHDKKSFRFIGKLRAVAKKKPLGGRDLNEYRLSDAARLTTRTK